MKFKLKTYNKNITDKELIQDVIKVAAHLEKDTLTISEYDQHGQYHSSTLTNRFRSWFNALKKAKLKPSRTALNLSDEELFLNIKDLWLAKNKQPSRRDLVKPLSKFSFQPYVRRFGSWQKALEAFVEYINDYSHETYSSSLSVKEKNNNVKKKKAKRKTKRDISERLRFSILLRDGFRCQSCGRSPIKYPGVELHVDHIIPWSKGGETIPDNLQTKCKECNLGKGNAFNK